MFTVQNLKNGVALTVLTAALLCPPAFAQDEENADERAGAGESDVIVVTAQKREEALIDIPQSVTVLAGESLERLQADSFLDYAAQVPGFGVVQDAPGSARLILRGINTGSVSSTLGVYMDETPFGSSTSLANGAVLAGDFDTFDIDRIEVLRGPQGTLYGANSLGGVLRFVTTAPRLGTYEARVQGGLEVTEGAADLGWSGNGMVNLPLGDNAAFRASGFYREDPGYIDAIGVPAEDINDAQRFGGRASVLFEPAETLSVRLTALYQKVDVEGRSAFDADPLTLEPLDTDPFTLAPLGGKLVRAQFWPEPQAVEYQLYNGTVDWDLGFATLTSSTSYGELDQQQINDQTIPLGALVTLLYGSPDDLGLIITNDINQKKVTQEVRLASPSSDRLEWLVGGYFTHEDALIDQALLPFDIAAQTLTDPALFGFPDFAILFLDSTYTEYAAFANATWHVTNRFEISAGGRYSYNEQDSEQFQDGAFQLLVDQPAPLVLTGESSEDVFTWSVAPRFEVNDHTSLYARVAKGYRPGGPNVVPPGAGPDYPVEFSADSLINYEVGVKAQSAGGMFSLDAAAFYIDWSDILIFASFPTGIGEFGANANGDTARSYGVEFTGTVRPVDGLTVLVNGAWSDAELTADTPPVVGGLDGDRLPFVPEWSSAVDVNYERPVFADATAFIGGTWRYVGEQAAGFDATFRAVFGQRQEVPDYHTLDLRAGLTFDRFTVTAYAQNVTDALGIVSTGFFGTRPGTAVAATTIRPRTFGMKLGARF